jgi:hypothetical protein
MEDPPPPPRQEVKATAMARRRGITPRALMYAPINA